MDHMLSNAALLPVSAAAAAAMIATALAMVLVPGPNMIYLLSRSIAQGRRAGLVSLGGTALGFVCYMLLANLGLAVVLVAVPWLFIGLKAAGALYLAHLAWRALRPGRRDPFELRGAPRHSAVRLFRMGLTTNLLNPKSAIMYLTLIPQYVDPARGHALLQGVTLGALQILVSVAVNALIVLAAGSLAPRLAARPAWETWQRRITGSLLGAGALLLAREIPARAHG
ncbi:LysE family translocator [Leucobacter allii]|uniref:LysE family translocator n=1 Tax=Leucobacter allii TaxID=2932247 RepID=A0ABY4FMQ5_9MICO|nr:LysE family translocator [Leucobacter allii]UOQ57534.1 LysE family translocator [Leucobacter allii]